MENIGKIHNLTRERIRQIETTGVKKLRQLESLNEHIKGLIKVITQLLEEHGGFMEKNYLLDSLVAFSVDGSGLKKSENLHKNHLDFLISRLLHNEFEEVIDSNLFKDLFKFKYLVLDHMEELAKEFINKIEQTKKVFTTVDLINFLKELETFKANIDKFQSGSNIDISGVLKLKPFDEDSGFINQHKTLYSAIQALKKIEQNKFGHWGVDEWREVKPKTINDKIYLVLKNNGKPMHFVGITEKINEISFDAKKANAATVHNELILDNKYILVGRGLYSLKEWGYKTGTVADVVVEILKNNPAGLTRDEIIEEVLKQRLVKRATIILALMNRDKFEKTENNKYKLK